MKRWICWIAAMIMFVSVLSISSHAALFGDVNGDGKINLIDTTLISKHVAGTFVLTDQQLAAADINGDGVVNMNDVMNHYRCAGGGASWDTVKTTTTTTTTTHTNTPITPAQVESYANSYMASLGINIDYSYTPSNSGYYAPRVFDRSRSFDEKTKADIRDDVDWNLSRCNAMIPGDYLRAYAEPTADGGVYLYILR